MYYLKYVTVEPNSEELADPQVKLVDGALTPGEWSESITAHFDAAADMLVKNNDVYFYVFHEERLDRQLGGESPMVVLYERRIGIYADVFDVEDTDVPPRWLQEIFDGWLRHRRM